MSAAPSTLVVFPNHIAGMTGIAYVRIGTRKVWATMIDHQTFSLPRRLVPVDAEGNSLAFAVAQLIADGPQGGA
jgi:hypothetical protein